MTIEEIKDKIKEKTGLSSKSIAYIIIALSAVVLMIGMNSFESGKKETKELEKDTSSFDTAYDERLKAELEGIISKIDGVGKVSVMITFSGSYENIYQQDSQTTSSGDETDTVIIGNKEALIKSIANPKVEGVLVVCEGGENIRVKEKVINAVSTVLNISSNKVYVTNRIKER